MINSTSRSQLVPELTLLLPRSIKLLTLRHATAHTIGLLKSLLEQHLLTVYVSELLKLTDTNHPDWVANMSQYLSQLPSLWVVCKE